MLGLILPLLPTAPFLLLAVGALPAPIQSGPSGFAAHPRFGSLLLNWCNERAIPLPAKPGAVGALGFSYATILWSKDSRPLHLILAVIMGGVALYLITRPQPSQA